jgi:hypothetical protein
MTSIISLRTSLLGLASWLVPFLISAAFYDRSGHLLILQPLFKSIMVVVGGTTGTVLLVIAFRRIAATPITGLVLGCYWLAINLVLDFIVLVGLMKMSAALYVYDIGLRYLLLPVIATAMGAVALGARKRTG